MALLDESRRLKQSAKHPQISPISNRCTHSLDSLHHSRAHHEDSQSAPTQSGNSDFALDLGQTCALLARLLQDTHAPQLVQELGFELLAQWVGLGVQLRELVGELTQRSAEGVVFLVVHWVLEEVPLTDLVLAVVAIGLVVMEVDLPEKPE